MKTIEQVREYCEKAIIEEQIEFMKLSKDSQNDLELFNLSNGIIFGFQKLLNFINQEGEENENQAI